MTANEVEAARREGRKVRYVNLGANINRYFVNIIGDVKDGRVDVQFDNPPHNSLRSALLDNLTEEQEGGKRKRRDTPLAPERGKRVGKLVEKEEEYKEKIGKFMNFKKLSVREKEQMTQKFTYMKQTLLFMTNFLKDC